MIKFAKNTAIYILVLVCMLFAIELYLQLSEIELAYHELNPDIGKKLKNNARIMTLKEGFYLGGANEFGYLGPGYPKRKKDNVFRIAIMGDSFTEGFQLFEKHHFRHIMEEQLNKNSGKEVQVLNFGLGGLNFSDMYIHYVNYASAFNPDLVIYIVRPNDMLTQPNFIPAPYLYLYNDKLKINYDFRYSDRYKTYQKYSLFFEKSSLVKMLNNAYKLVNQGFLPQIFFDKFHTDLYVPFKYPPKMSRVDRENAIKQSISRNFKKLNVTRKIIDTLGKNGNVYFVYRSDFPDNIHKYIVNSGIKVISVDRPLNDLRKKGIDPIYWKASRTKGHWNRQAHRAIGNYLAETIGNSIK